MAEERNPKEMEEEWNPEKPTTKREESPEKESEKKPQEQPGQEKSQSGRVERLEKLPTKQEERMEKVEAMKPRQKPFPGRIVLLATNVGDRPMMIVKVLDEKTVNGVIFLDGWNDRGLAIIGVREGSLMSWANTVTRGAGVNQWRFYDD